MVGSGEWRETLWNTGILIEKKSYVLKMDEQRMTGKKLQVSEYVGDGGLDSLANDCLIESTRYPTAGNVTSMKTRLNDVRNNLMASKELVKVLFRMLSEEQQHSWGFTLVSVLKVEIDRAMIQIDRTIQERRFTHNEVDVRLKQFTVEKATWKSEEEESFHEALRELATEKRMRRQAKRLT
ncbi:hypothetical protein Droror1_Dr00014986 [Drosera rotundifolia]